MGARQGEGWERRAPDGRLGPFVLAACVLGLCTPPHVPARAQSPEQPAAVRQDPRGIAVQPKGAGERPAPQTPGPIPQQAPGPPGVPSSPGEAPIRVAALGGKGGEIAGFVLPTPYEVVSPEDRPDLVWDPATRDVTAGGAIVARGVERLDLPGVIERAAAVRGLAARVAKAPLRVRVAPHGGLHRRGEQVAVEIAGLNGRSLVLFNLAGDGAVELLYPQGSDPAIIERDAYVLELKVREPFGSDQIVAVSGDQRLVELEKALRQLERRKSPARVLDLLDRSWRPDLRLGTASIFTGP